MQIAELAMIFATFSVLVALLVVARQLHALRQADGAAKPAAERTGVLESVLAALPYAILLVDREGQCVEELSAGERVSGRLLLEDLPDDAHATFMQCLRIAIDDNLKQQVRFVARDRWFIAEILPIASSDGRRRRALVVLRDATEEKETDSRAEQLAARNEAILRSAMDGFFVVGENYRFLEVNDAFCRMTGYRPDELLKMTISDLEVNEPLRGLAASTHTRTGLHQFASAHRHKDGHVIQLEISVIVLRDGGQKILVGFARDVTERSRAEGALRESEERFRRLSDLAFEGIAVHENGVISDANRSFARMFGYELSEIVGTEGLNYIAPAFRDEVSRRTLEGFDRPYEVIGLRNGGATFPIEVCGRVISSPGRQIQVVAVRDITERKLAEEALRQSEKKYRALVETSHDLIWAVDNEGRWTFVNQAARHIYGYEPEEMLGRRFTEFMPAAQAAKDRVVFEHIRNGQPQFQYETQHLRRDRTPILLSFNAIAMRDDRGNVIGATGTAMDVTARHSAEEERRKLERRMQETQKLESLGMLAGGVAHDFNNFLVGMLCNASLALESVPEESPVRKHLQKIINASRRASELTRQMLAYSGRATYDVHPLDVNTLVHDMADFMRASLPKNVSLEIATAEHLPLIEADGGQFQQIIMNLLINGAEAIGDEPGVVRVCTSQRRLENEDIRLDFADQNLTPGAFVSLEVSDNGCGMSAETLSRMFDPFFTTKFAGRGLGLASILGIIRAHRGAVKVSSELNRGTTFMVLFPALLTPRVLPKARPASKRLPAGSTVLVIDDEEDIRDAVETVLSARGVRVLTADGGVSGLAIYRQQPDQIDLVLLDMTMPGMDGATVLKEILEIRADADVVLSSGYSEQEAVARFGNKRIAGFVHKPYTPETLIAHVGSVLERHAGAQVGERTAT